MWKHLRRWLGREEVLPDPAVLAREEALAARLRERCTHFRRLLSANKNALEVMSEIEERLAGRTPFGMEYIRAVTGRALSCVFQVVRELNALSDGAYASVQEAFERIRSQMELLLAQPENLPLGPLVMPLSEVRLSDLSRVGGKMANLGEVAANAGLDVPDGFVVTVDAYHRFMAHNGLRGDLERRLQAADMHNLDEVFSLSVALQQAVLAAPLPPDLAGAITASVAEMQQRADRDLLLALRSSALGEDALGVTFAGQYRSELNVPPEEACDVWKEIIASKYTVSALSYRYQHGIPDDAAPMCVGVLAMVRAVAGGVAYSRDPVPNAQAQERVILNAVPGLPQAVVDGTVTPDVFVFSHENPPRLLEKHLMQGTSPSPGVPSLTDAQAAQLAQVALALEEYYTTPQDVEWALDAGGRIMVLQSRPLHADQFFQTSTPGEALPPGLTVLAQGGVSVSPGVGVGPVFVARKEADMLAFPQGSVLVVKRASPRWATLLPRAAGLVSESGGTAGHLASVAREYRVPAIFSLPGACDLLDEAGEVTLDAGRGVVLAGRQAQLVPPVSVAPNLMAGSPLYLRLEALGKWITPLHLLDPDAPGFSPEQCRSLHDITRFCHEKSVYVMFEDDTGLGRCMGKQLKAGGKLQYWVVDMGGGFHRPVRGPVVELSNIACLPMLALWEGMVAVPWAGPPSSASGFMSVVFESTMNPDLESTAPSRMAERNFFIVSDTYMILQARYGYHFCTVESLAGGDSHENFVNFQFKGGAADRQRRQLRAQMLAGLLEEHGFHVDVRDDSLFAVAEGFDAGATLNRTLLVGYLLIHSRQVDVVMREGGRAAALREKLATDLARLAEREPACARFRR